MQIPIAKVLIFSFLLSFRIWEIGAFLGQLGQLGQLEFSFVSLQC
jgi:hypothetical protein